MFRRGDGEAWREGWCSQRWWASPVGLGDGLQSQNARQGTAGTAEVVRYCMPVACAANHAEHGVEIIMELVMNCIG
jgi:hypothetical protein